MLTLCLPAAGIQEVEAVAIWRGRDVVRKKGEDERTRRFDWHWHWHHGHLRDHCCSATSHLVSPGHGTRHVVVLAPNLYKYYS